MNHKAALSNADFIHYHWIEQRAVCTELPITAGHAMTYPADFGHHWRAGISWTSPLSSA
jgi:hypothetical protein